MYLDYMIYSYLTLGYIMAGSMDKPLAVYIYM